jgi:hypothetical protein
MKHVISVRLKSILLSAGVAAAVATSALPVQAATQPPEVVIEVNEAGFKVPATVPGGIVAISIKNTGKAPHAASIARLRDGKTLADLIKFQAQTPEDIVGAMKLANIVSVGDPLAPGQTDKRGYVDLKRGNYFIADDITPKLQNYTAFKVTTIGNAVAPKADVVVTMNDFTYAMPSQIKAGKQMWQFNNKGKQWHMAAIVKTKPGATMEDVMKAFAMTGPGPMPTPDPNAKAEVMMSVGMPPTGEGERAWREFNLEPGTYMLVCPLPDITSMGKGEIMSHSQLGMMKEFTVK